MLTQSSIVEASLLPDRYDIPAENRSENILQIVFNSLTE